MQEVSFEDALEIITLKDPRYPREAYLFVREALDHTQRWLAKEKPGGIRHVSGQELLAGIKDYAVTQFGPMASTVFEEWGIRCCQDFGELVFNMVETGGCPTLSSDDITDVPALINRLSSTADSFSVFLWQQIEPAARAKLSAAPEEPQTRELLTEELNRLITSTRFYEEERFASIELPPEAKCLCQHPLQGVAMGQFNRLLLEWSYPKQIAKSHGLLAKTKNDSRADFQEGYDFFEAFRKPFLPPSKQPPARPTPAPSAR